MCNFHTILYTTLCKPKMPNNLYTVLKLMEYVKQISVAEEVGERRLWGTKFYVSSQT